MEKTEKLYKEWQSLQPLKPEDKKRLDDKFMLEFNYNSNHIEGNTLTYGQTKLLFMFGETVGSASLRDYEEMKAHNVGLELMKREAADKERPLTENFIRELNKTILVENYWKIEKDGTRSGIKVGVYKTRPNSVITVTGEPFEYALPQETPALMTDLVAWYNEEETKGILSPIQLAALLHYRYIRIHPFEDGNGRIARLLVNYVLARHNYPMIIVRSDDKENYLQVLHQCDIVVGERPSDGTHATIEQVQPFVEYLTKQLERALEISIKAAKGERIEESDDFAKRINILAKRAKQKVETKESQTTSKAKQIRSIIDLFYIPFTDKLVEALKPATTFFERIRPYNCISTKSDNSFEIPHLNRDTIISRDVISQAKILCFGYLLDAAKKEYGLKELFITIQFTIRFEDSYYRIKYLDKDISYGSYPSEEDENTIISKFKTEALQQIEAAMNTKL